LSEKHFYLAAIGATYYDGKRILLNISKFSRIEHFNS
jgi:hypothetical protein